VAGDARLVLASSSPRRLALLRQVGIEPNLILPPEIDEAVRPKELPRRHAERLALDKLNAVRMRTDAADAFVLAADTVVACGRRILPKTDERAAAERCLTLLSGRRHSVLGGVAVAAPDGTVRSRLIATAVRFKRLTRSEIDHYLASGEWQGKAGGYAIQGRAEAFVLQINGSWSNVVGLPLAATVNLLRGLGYTGGG
jgi:septum formation protein